VVSGGRKEVETPPIRSSIVEEVEALCGLEVKTSHRGGGVGNKKSTR